MHPQKPHLHTNSLTHTCILWITMSRFYIHVDYIHPVFMLNGGYLPQNNRITIIVRKRNNTCIVKNNKIKRTNKKIQSKISFPWLQILPFKRSHPTRTRSGLVDKILTFFPIQTFHTKVKVEFSHKNPFVMANNGNIIGRNYKNAHIHKIRFLTFNLILLFYWIMKLCKQYTLG